jgi:pimeloyl-ACP methyl ester carboxylesterase
MKPKAQVPLEVDIPLGDLILPGLLYLPAEARGLVLFSHGSGSSRFSTRNNYVARVLCEQGLGALLFDLLTEAEDQIYENRFNIDLLSERLIAVTEWVAWEPHLKNLPLGYFGASTGAASALRAAAYFGKRIASVVSRGGRPDLAGNALSKVLSPTLLLVGGLDDVVIELNRQAARAMPCDTRLEIIPGATHLFEEPGKLEEVAQRSAAWFLQQLHKEKTHVQR